MQNINGKATPQYVFVGQGKQGRGQPGIVTSDGIIAAGNVQAQITGNLPQSQSKIEAQLGQGSGSNSNTNQVQV